MLTDALDEVIWERFENSELDDFTEDLEDNTWSTAQEYYLQNVEVAHFEELFLNIFSKVILLQSNSVMPGFDIIIIEKNGNCF